MYHVAGYVLPLCTRDPKRTSHLVGQSNQQNSLEHRDLTQEMGARGAKRPQNWNIEINSWSYRAFYMLMSSSSSIYLCLYSSIVVTLCADDAPQGTKSPRTQMLFHVLKFQKGDALPYSPFSSCGNFTISNPTLPLKGNPEKSIPPAFPQHLQQNPKTYRPVLYAQHPASNKRKAKWEPAERRISWLCFM